MYALAWLQLWPFMCSLHMSTLLVFEPLHKRQTKLLNNAAVWSGEGNTTF